MFIISHYAGTDQHNCSLDNCIKSLIMHYGNEIPIFIVDDHSPVPIPEHIKNMSNVRVDSNPFPKSGEVGSMYWYLKHPEVGPHAFIIHDSMIAMHAIDPIKCLKENQVCLLWYFDRAFGYHIERIIGLLQNIIETSKSKSDKHHLIQNFLNNAGKTWVGSFGISALVTHERLSYMQELYNLFGCISKIVTREDREAFERIFGMISCLSQNKVTSICGNIFDHPHMNTGYFSKMTLDELQSQKQNYKAPFLKCWFGR